MLLKGLVLLTCLFASAIATTYDNDLDEETLQADFQRARRISEGQIKACGERLFTIVNMVCANVRRKRQALLEPRDLYTSVYSPDVENDRFYSEGAQWTFQPSSGARDRFQKVGMLRNLKKRNTGITNACCYQSCTLKQMELYC